MRQAYQSIALIGMPLPFAISLGFDFCAEHETGLRGIQNGLGIDPDAEPGLARRQATIKGRNLFDYVHFKDFPKDTKTMRAETRLMVDFGERDRNLQMFETRRMGLMRDMGKDIYSCWREDAFCVQAYSDEAREFISALHDAILSGDICLGHGVSQAFGRSPLTLAIPSRMPPEVSRKILDDDLAHDRLIAAAFETGIEARLKAAGLGFYHLRPEWTDHFETLVGRKGKPSDETEHQVIFFLNPMRQSETNYGWFTVEELDQWIDGQGPILKKNEHPSETAPSL